MSTSPSDFEALPDPDSEDAPGDGSSPRETSTDPTSPDSPSHADPSESAPPGDPRSDDGARDAPGTDDASADSPPSIEELLDRLRARTDQLVKELRRLRAENRRMRARLDELEDLVESSETLLPLDESQEELRTRIEGFIDVIDDRLARVHEHSDQSTQS